MPPTQPGTSLETPDSSRKGSRELYKWLVDDLPWSRLGVWLAVAWLAFQLKDFFGVSTAAIQQFCLLCQEFTHSSCSPSGAASLQGSDSLVKASCGSWCGPLEVRSCQTRLIILGK